MVAYCCVKGCNNNSSIKKKDPNDITSFHAFPTKFELRQKWLRAIGRPEWDPPKYARVCSTHFSFEQVKHDRRRVRIKDDAIPFLELPVNSNFEASDLEVCRFCLAMDVKLFSLQSGVYNLYLQSFVGYAENCDIEGLPHFVCYECAAHLQKCYNLLGKSMIAQTTLLDIFARNGKITRNLIKLKNRKDLKLTSSLSEVKINYAFGFNDNSEFIIKNDDVISNNNDADIVFEDFNDGLKLGFENTEFQGEDTNDLRTEEDISLKEENYEQDIKCDIEVEFENDRFSDCKIDASSDDEVVFESVDAVSQEMVQKNITNERVKKTKSVNIECLTPDEINMQKYFTIEALTLEEQIEEWNKTNKHKNVKGESFKCQICLKVFANKNTYKIHILKHDASRGKVECPVCKLRFKRYSLARIHADRHHSRKFHCKTCSRVLSNVDVAKKHHKWHSGQTYKCGRCPFTTAHTSALNKHVRSQHSGEFACARCGHAFVSAKGLRQHTALVHQQTEDEENIEKYTCEQCDLSFNSEGARRVHILTSVKHKKKKPSLCEASPEDLTVKKTCNKCGQVFPTVRALVAHGREEHGTRKHKKTSWSLPEDSYPTRCDHCNVSLNNRREHWIHVIKVHPDERASYRAVVTAVCPTCGKGFQNTTKLHLHELRHSAPTVPCPECPRMCYDKHALARHRANHAPARPHRCALCPLAFKQRANLERHARVHTGQSRYACPLCDKRFGYSSSRNLHVRTVHQKLPLPPRKKRNKRKLDESDG